jgi:hypothetical protein
VIARTRALRTRANECLPILGVRLDRGRGFTAEEDRRMVRASQC